jgi:septum site-determining protein MinC
LIIDAPVRSGQTITNLEGDITIVGRVASGAEIIAGGSVHIYGAVQGRIIAGVSGTPDARIFCTEARAELLCIGGAYATAENMDPKTEGKSLEIRLAEGHLKFRILN